MLRSGQMMLAKAFTTHYLGKGKHTVMVHVRPGFPSNTGDKVDDGLRVGLYAAQWTDDAGQGLHYTLSWQRYMCSAIKFCCVATI